MNLATSPVCVGINAAMSTSLATTNIAGHEMVEIPRGHAVIGSGYLYHNNYIKGYVAPKPRWFAPPRFFMANAATSEERYFEIMKDHAYRMRKKDHPATHVSYLGALQYLQKLRVGLSLPPESWWEVAARGPANNVPELMEEREGRYIPADVADFMGSWIENIVFEVGGEIHTDPRGEEFQGLIRKKPYRPFYGWYAFGTASGRFLRDEAWYDRHETVPVKWGTPNAYGLYNITGNVWEMMLHSGFIRGGDFRGSTVADAIFRAGFQKGAFCSIDEGASNVGFRVAAPASAVK